MGALGEEGGWELGGVLGAEGDEELDCELGGGEFFRCGGCDLLGELGELGADIFAPLYLKSIDNIPS